MYVYIEACPDLCILDPPHMVIPFSPLWLHSSLFTVTRILWNVSTVTRIIYFMAELTCMSTLTHSEADSHPCNFMNMKRNDHITFPNRAKSFSIVNFYCTSSIKHLPFHILCCSLPATNFTNLQLFHFIPRALCLYCLHCLTFRCSRFIQERWYNKLLLTVHHYALQYTFGVNAWRQWVMAKNAELEKAATNNRKLKLFKPEILQLTADELNYSLCLFVKEVRKPNGSEYAPDTIYYLCLGKWMEQVIKQMT